MKYMLVDSREKPKAIKNILAHFDKIGLVYESTKLLFGDYMDWNRPGVVIDRKQSIRELAQNCTSGHERFRREMERAQKAGAVLVILVEQNRYKYRGEFVHVDQLEDLIGWSDPHTVITGEKIFRVLRSWCAKYPIRVEFCDKRSTGRRIYEIIYKEAK